MTYFQFLELLLGQFPLPFVWAQKIKINFIMAQKKISLEGRSPK